jgi:hypothetical protein
MPILTGAVAYRGLVTDEVKKQISIWQDVQGREVNIALKQVSCPRCGTAFALLEELGISDEILKEDLEFLEKAISSSHPIHPDHMIIRDPSGMLFGHFGQVADAREFPNIITGP